MHGFVPQLFLVNYFSLESGMNRDTDYYANFHGNRNPLFGYLITHLVRDITSRISKTEKSGRKGL